MNIKHYFSLKSYNTFGLDVQACHFYQWDKPSNIDHILKIAPDYSPHILLLGGGSNTIFSHHEVDAFVIHVATKGIKFYDETTNSIKVRVEAGEIWHDFVQVALSHGLSGMENLSLIPGTVGASPIQNIGAYGVEVSKIISRVFVIDMDNTKRFILSNGECQFGYRDSIFKKNPNWLIEAVEFTLSKKFIPNIGYGDLAQVAQKIAGNKVLTPQIISSAVCQIRREKLPDPQVIGNVGSFFRNPIITNTQAIEFYKKFPTAPRYQIDNNHVKIPAGWLIEHAGLKGFHCGGVSVYDNQALVAINSTGKAKPEDVLQYRDAVIFKVWQYFGIHLQAEPVIY